MEQPDDGEELQARVIAWLRANDWRYRAASRAFNVPYATVQVWGKAARGGGSLPKPDSRTASRARATPADATPVPFRDPVEWDPTECTREEFLVQGIRRCLAAATADGVNGQVARQWETSAGKYRDELDRLRDERRRADEAKGRSERVDIEDLAKRLCRRAGILARLAPDEARRLYHELGVALGEREAG